jgi:hypothetical protein
VSPTALLPLLFRLFRAQDKVLRALVFRHVTADIRAANRHGKNDRHNRAVQNFMYRCGRCACCFGGGGGGGWCERGGEGGRSDRLDRAAQTRMLQRPWPDSRDCSCGYARPFRVPHRLLSTPLRSVLEDEHEGVAKKGLAVLTEMWRRRVWRDARTVNVIASAALHRSPRVMLGALKFFLGQDEKAEEGDDAGAPAAVLLGGSLGARWGCAVQRAGGEARGGGLGCSGCENCSGTSPAAPTAPAV